ncbi:hypothetical protein Anas_05505, partial [Armadillidium nasatum]
DGKVNPIRTRLANILNGSLHLNPVTIPDLLPKFLKVTNKGQASYVKQLASEKDGFVDLNFTLQSDGFQSLSSTQEWWEVEEDCSKGNFSIVGMYTTIVLLVSKMLRIHFAGVSSTIMFDDMPNVDRLLQLCLDIYLVRESGELELEEDLFAKLIFLFRSPETLIKWTRPKEEETPEQEEPQGEIQ